MQYSMVSVDDIDFDSRKAHEAASRRNEAAKWLRNMVGFFGGRELPDQLSEEEFKLGLRSGIVLCNVLNKVQPGAVPKVVEAPAASILVPDGTALSVFQYFENVRNFLVSAEEMGLPSFEASDLEKGGKSSRIVNCILALKSYSDWKQAGGKGLWKFGGNQKPSSSIKQFIRRNAELFKNSIVRTTSAEEKSLDSLVFEESTSDDDESDSLTSLVHKLLQDKKQEDIPIIVGSMLNKVMEEFEHKLTLQEDQSKITSTTSNGPAISESAKSPVEIEQEIVSNLGKSAPEFALQNENMEDKTTSKEVETSQKEAVETSQEEAVETSQEEAVETSRGKLCSGINEVEIALKSQLDRWQTLAEKYQRDIQELKNILDAAKSDVHSLKTQHQEEVSNLGKHLDSLTHAAKGYKKAVEENRKLYNLVQDLKGNIRVYCRVRPFLPGQANNVTSVGNLDDGNITIIPPSKYGKEARRTFTFNKVFGSSATQVEVFSDTQPLIRSVLDGYNVCIFAYGQTGSGKTYSMSGPNDITNESAGVNYRALRDLFIISEERKYLIAYDVSVQMIEIYNEQVRDLLVTDGADKRLEIHNSSQNGINVPDANIVRVASTSDVISLMNLGQKNRTVGSTAMNDRSSRSHSCLMVHVQGRDLSSGSVIRGCMHLVDLAGSERVDESEAVGDRLKEAQHINKSLSALGDVISSLSQKNAHVPYRNSKLTQLLQDSLVKGGQAKTLLFVHIRPEPDSFGETISTLKFAERVSNVELKDNKDSSDVRELKEQISSLKAALAIKDGDSGRLQYSISRCTDDADSIEPPEVFCDMDDQDAATTDSSEPDIIIQTYLARSSSLPNRLGMGIKSKKTGSKQANGQDKRGSIPAPPKRGVSNGISQLSQKTGKPSASPDQKRRPVRSK